MKNEKTGIVRRVDYLGRVVIPMEMRKTLKWNVNDPVEIVLSKNEVVLKKYSPIASVASHAALIAKGIEEQTEKICIVTDTDNVIYASEKYKEFTGRKISEKLEQTIRAGKSLLLSKSEGGEIIPVVKGENVNVDNQIIVPILSEGYFFGAVILIDADKGQNLTANDVKLARLGAFVLSNI